MALRELSLFTAYSFMCVCNFSIDTMVFLNREIISGDTYLTDVNIIIFFSLIMVCFIQCGILIFTLKKITSCYRYQNNYNLNKEMFFICFRQ